MFFPYKVIYSTILKLSTPNNCIFTSNCQQYYHQKFIKTLDNYYLVHLFIFRFAFWTCDFGCARV